MFHFITVKFMAATSEMLLIVACILLITSQLSVSRIERNSTRKAEDQKSLQVETKDVVNYVSDSKDSLDPSCRGPWTIAKEDSGNTSCECGSNLKGWVQCDDSSFNLQLLPCYCMTPYEKDPNITVVGACLYKCDYLHGQLYYPVPAKDPVSHRCVLKWIERGNCVDDA